MAEPEKGPGSGNTVSFKIDAGTSLPARNVETLLSQIDRILSSARERERSSAVEIRAADPRFQQSARNLLHYLALRNEDIRPLQEQLAQMGLSSLGRAEAHVMASLIAVREVLGQLAGKHFAKEVPPVTFGEGAELLARHTEAIFGPAPPDRNVRIMVTLPTEAADDFAMVRNMIVAGMNCARINCAHDDADVWVRMTENVRRASAEMGRTCQILMDVNGPRLRTGPIEPGPKVVRWRPHRDARGHVVAPARIWLYSPDAPPLRLAGVDVTLPVDAAALGHVKVGDRLRFRDTRGKKRSLDILERHPSGCLAVSYETAYVETGTRLKLRRARGGKAGHSVTVGELPPANSFLLLRRGETLILRRDMQPGKPAERAEDGSVRTPASIPCTLPEAFADVQPGDLVKLDDGMIEGIVLAVSEKEIRIEITHAKDNGSKLRADKGINFPLTTLHVRGLTPKDLQDLDVIAQHADMVGLSFVNSADDVRALCTALADRGAEHIGVVLKIETRRGFEQLPSILMASLRRYPVGVMIARGDLAVECGWERLAEVQEEILWLCEAAHVPVVWATQVLESLAKTGQPSRAEITDAAMSERAECVMLNKGPHLLKAIQTLDDILKRMQAHQTKKTPMLRSLYVARTP